MIEESKFKAGMHALGVAFNRTIDEDTARVYDEVLSMSLTDAEWKQAVATTLIKERFFPPPSVLLDYGRPSQPPTTSAVVVFDQIMEEFELGRSPGPRLIQQEWGSVAMDCFVAAGGVRAFGSAGSEETRKWVRKAFVETWREEAKSRPMLPAPPPPLGELGDGRPKTKASDVTNHEDPRGFLRAIQKKSEET